LCGSDKTQAIPCQHHQQKSTKAISVIAINFLSCMRAQKKKGHSQKQIRTGNVRVKILTETTSMVKFSSIVIKHAKRNSKISSKHH